MDTTQLLQRRAHAQGIDARFETPQDVVRGLLAMQAQDYLGSLWAVGLRMRDPSQAAVEAAIAQRRIVRTWPMRGTLHLLVADDVRWMLELLAARSIARDAGRLVRQHGLDAAALQRCRKVIAKVLRDGQPVQRSAVYQALDDAGIVTAQQRGLNITGRLAQEGLICGGPRDGKQPTFVLLDAWVPQAPAKSRDEALAQATLRYFSSRGPATAQDFAWWSGLTLKDAQAGLAMAGNRLAQDTIDGRTYWRAPDAAAASANSVVLLPPFDEYLLAYADRSAALDPAHGKQVLGVNGLVSASIVVDGKVAGIWKRVLRKDAVSIAASPFAPLKQPQAKALVAAARHYGDFLGLSAELT